MVLVSRKAPNFTASAVLSNNVIIENFNFKDYIKNKYSVLFFWPLDFTFVCPSEIIAFNKRYEEFKKLNTKIVGVSCDSVFVHLAWKKTPINQGGIGEINYPMISDIKKNIMQSYDIEYLNKGISLRGSFLIDKNFIIRHQIVNDLPIGRNIDEMLRTVRALQFHEKSGEVCPAQWEEGLAGIKPNNKGIAKYLSENIDIL